MDKDKNNNEASLLLGKYYEKNKDYPNYIKYLLKSSQNGNSKANLLLGIDYLKNKNDIQALHYLKLASKQYNNEAMYQLAIYYNNKNNEFCDFEKCIKYYDLGSKFGHPM
jgi:TPR repeat protein